MTTTPATRAIAEAFLDELADYPEFMGLARPGINSVGGFGNTPLKIASVQGNVAVISALLDYGADINALNEDGCTALHHAVSQGHTEAAALLVKRGADATTKDRFGKAPLDYAETPELRALFNRS
jgi:ankyrin repeat protein